MDYKSWWVKPSKVVENNRTTVLWDFEFQADKQLLANQPDRLTGWQDCSCDRCGDPSRQKIQEDSIIETNKIKSNNIRGHCPKEFNPRNKTLWRSLKVSHFGYVHIHPLHWTFTSMAYWNGCKRWNMNEWIWNYAYGLGEGQLTLPLSGLLMTH